MRIILSFLLSLFSLNAATASEVDTAFIRQVTDYAAKELGLTSGRYYNKWDNRANPYYVVYISDRRMVALVPGSPWLQLYKNKAEADSVCTYYAEKGHHTFIYHSYANSEALLHPRFSQYSREALSFIIFHELAHNYVFKNLWLPYNYHEAMCDVIAAHGMMKFARETNLLDTVAARLFVQHTEQIYVAISECTRKLNRMFLPDKGPRARCEKRIAAQLALSPDTFLHDRFEYPVNNGYLLKNGYYCNHYFKLKAWLEEDRDIDTFLKRMVALFPKSPDNDEAYLRW